MFGYILLIVFSILFFSGVAFSNIITIDVYLKGLDFDFPKIDDDGTVFLKVTNVFYGTITSVVIVVIAMIWMGLRGRKIWNELSELQKLKIRQSYFLTFETTVPKGKDDAEKIFSIVSKVFPEIKEAIKEAGKKHKKFQYEVDKEIKGAVYDLKLNTD